MARYTYWRLRCLPATGEGLRRYMAERGGPVDLECRCVVLRPAEKQPVEIDDRLATLIYTTSGRGVMRVDGDRFEVHARDLVQIPPGCPYAVQSLGMVDWVFLTARHPDGASDSEGAVAEAP